GYLVNAQGYFLTGYIRNPADGSYSLQPEPIQLPMGNIAPRATGATQAGGADAGVVARAMNLDARADAITASFDSTKPETFNMSVPLTIYDSLGREHQLTQYFVKKDSNQWMVYFQLDDGPISATGHD